MNRMQDKCEIKFARIEQSRLVRTPRKKRARKSGNQWRGRIPIPTHCHPLVRAWIAALNDQQTSLTEVSNRCGMDRRALSDWRYRRMPRLDNFEAALNVIGLRLVILPLEDDA